MSDRQRIFTSIYATNVWDSEESRSGDGSTLAATAATRLGLMKILREYEVTRFLDAPCGDWNWMREVDLGGVEYIGVDIVPDIVEANRGRYETSNVTFRHADIARDPLPESDLILCRDALQHMAPETVLATLANFKKSARYVLLTSYHQQTQNVAAAEGYYFPYNLRLAPFNLPVPLDMIDEGGLDSNEDDKALFLWATSDLSDLL